jgi:DNA-binding SARP family transcriptional activator
MGIRLLLFGGFEARLDSGSMLRLPTRKTRALLAYLAVHPGQSQPRDKLATLLWGESGRTQARTSLRQSLAALRKSLGAHATTALHVDAKAISLDPAVVEADVDRFERLVAEASPAALEEAVALYRGELLEGFEEAAAPFEDWLLVERERLRERALEALARLLRHQADTGDLEAAIRTAQRLVAVDPLQEAAHRTLMRLYLGQGRRANALRQYQTCVGVLQRELGVEPEPETRDVYQTALQHRARQVLEPEPPVPPASGPGPARAGWRGLEPPLVGRGGELSRLRRLLDAAAHGRGSALVVVSEAGVGKTRLLDELGDRGGSLVGRCHDSEQILPFGPWVEALRVALACQPALRDRLGSPWCSELARLLPELADTPAGQGARSSDGYLRLFEAVGRALQVLAAPRPLLVVMEDLHWADDMSLRLFGYLARRVAGWPVMLVGSAREEEVATTPPLARLLEELGGGPEFVLLTLSPLSRRETHDLVRAFVSAATRPSALGRVAAKVWALSEGNPFVAVETLRAVQEGQRLDASAVTLPERVRAVIGGRLDRLSARARELLAVAAIIGREFDFSLLQRACGLDEPAAAEGVEELVRRRILHGVGPQLDFAHDRLREVAYGRILPARRTLLHRAVAEAMERADDRDPHHGSLGVHYRLGGIWDKAVAHLRQAASRASDYSAHREAVAHLEQALQAAECLPDEGSRQDKEFGIRIQRETSYWALGELQRVADQLEPAEALARKLEDPLRLARVDTLAAGCLAAMGQPDRAIARGERGLAAAEAAGHVPLQLSLAVLLVFAHCGRGDFRTAVALARRNAVLAKGVPVDRSLGQVGLPAVFSRVWLVIPLGELGEFAEARPLAEEAVAIAEDVGQGYSRALAHWALGCLHYVRDDRARAISHLERSAALCRDYELIVLSAAIHGSLGAAYAASGRLAEAVPLLEKAVAQGESRSSLWWRARRTAQLGEAYLSAGRVPDARAAGERALALADADGERASRAYALRLLGEVGLRRGARDVGAALRLEDGLAVARELGMRPLAARCQLDLARLHQRAGRASTAGEHLAAARAQFAELDMRPPD